MALVDDLLFASRIGEAARVAGVEVRVVRDPGSALERSRAEPPAAVFLDLDRERLRPIEAVRLLRGEPGLAGLEIVGFASHVHAERRREAKQAGCTRVLSRGAFVRALPKLLARPLGSATPGADSTWPEAPSRDLLQAGSSVAVNERDKPGGAAEPRPEQPADSEAEEAKFEERRHETISIQMPHLASARPSSAATRDETVRGPLEALVEARAVPERACLVVLRGRHIGQLFELGDEAAILGRGEDATIQVDDTATSRHHARIEPTAIGYLIVDLESTNGTLVNAHKISRHVLRDGDRIQVGGETVLEFSYRDEVQTGVQRRLFESATRDPLTGLHNRGYFLEALDEAFAHARRLKRPLSLLMLDIDLFKRVNDTHGHATGDAVLQQFADLVRDLVRREDVPTRFGGEEFVLMLRESGISGCRLLGDRIRAKVEENVFAHEAAKLRLTVSVGGATYWNANYESPAQLLEAADAAVYQAKAAGRNKVVIKIDDAPAPPHA